VLPAGVDLGVEGLEPWLTPAADFYRIDTSLAPPLVTPEDWQLRIHGMVDREITITYEQLLDRGLQDAWVTLCCVSNEVGGDLISNALWSGVPVADLLAEAGAHPDADAVLQTSSDGWTCGTPLAALTDGRSALLAVAMNGEPLPVEHGFPVRVVVPGLYGFVSATKWVVDWEVTRFSDFDAYWTERGWAEQGPVKTQSRIDTPRSGADVSAGTVRVGGIAWAQHTGIERVEVRVDGGDWAEATLGADPSIDTWVQWVWEWDATPGAHVLAVRATDRTGATQTSEVAETVPDGATGWHTVRVDVG
jgi:DMSO/TMAO reductase YedYZ molybdopterin-dependent catalytic subunit